MMADEALDIRKWKQTNYEVFFRRRSASVSDDAPSSIHLSVRCRTRPPPIGCMEWPAGRVLLQWALDEAGLGEHDGSGGVVLELGAGIGITAIGLAVAQRQSSATQQQIVATDVCADTLTLLRSNAEAHGIDKDALRVAHWDAALGEESVRTLPCPLAEVSHILGADVIYYGFGVNNPADNTEPGEHVSSEAIGLPHTLAALLRERPSLRVSLLVVDRFSGGMVSAVAATAGVHQPSTTVDPAVTRFVRGCEEVGLVVESTPLPPSVIATVMASQSLLARAVWWVAGHYDGMAVLSVRPAAPAERKYVRLPEGVHEGIGCDRTGRLPILGNRFSLPGHDYDLCEAEYLKLSEADKRRFTKIPPPSYYMRRPELVLEGAPPAPLGVPVRSELPLGPSPTRDA